jgi:hypothetical protein
VPFASPRSTAILHHATWGSGRWLGGLWLVYSLNAIENLAQIALLPLVWLCVSEAAQNRTLAQKRTLTAHD